MKNFNLIEMAKAMKEHKLRHMWRYVAMIFAVLVMSIANIGMAWGTDLEIPLTNLSKFPLDYGLVTITNTEKTTISNPNLTVKKATAKFKVETNISGVYLKSISFKDFNPTKNGGFACEDNASYMVGPTDSIYTYTAPNTTTTEANFTLTGSGGTAQIGTIIITISTSDQVERLSAFGSISDQKIPFTSSAATTCIELSVPASNGVSISSKRIAIPTSAKHLIVSTKNGETIKYIAIPKYQQSTNAISGSSDPSGTYSSDGWTPSSSDVESVDLSLTASGGTTYSQEIFVVYTSGGGCTPITPTWSTDYSSTTLNVGATSSTPVVGKDGSSGAVTFSSSDTDIATVNSSGVVTGVGAGTATITATVAADGGKCEGTVTKSFTIKAGITYNANGADGGSVPTDASIYAYNANITVAGNTGSLYKTGKVFNGWNTSSDGTGTHYEAGATMKMPSKSTGVTLYAEWVGYATSWEWWNSGQSHNSTTFTYLTNKNYICSFKSSASTAVASWDITGTIVYRGVKMKTKDHYMYFWVPTGKRVSITFGYMSAKPTFTVGGVNKAGDLTTSTTDSATVTYTTTADTKFYIENETATNTAFTVKSVKIEDDAPSCPDAWSFHSKNSSSEWRDPICMELEGDGDFYISEETAINVGDVSYKVGYQGVDEAKTTETDWQWMPMGPARNWTVGAHPTASNAGGALGYFYIHSTYTDNNRYIGFFPSSYMLRQGSGDSWSNTTFNPASSAYGETVWTTPVQKYTASNAADYMYTALGTGNGGAVGCAMSTAMRPIYLKLHSDWKASSPKFYIYYFKNGTDKNGWSGLMQAVSGTGGDDLVGWIPEGDWDRVQFVRFNPGDAVASWDGNVWNSTYAITLDSEKNYYVLEAQGNGGALDWYGHWDLYHNGFYRIWVDNASTNFALHYVPQYVLEYDNNGGSGSIDPQSVALDADPNTVTVKAVTGFTAPEGKHFVNWNTAPGGGGTSYDPSDSYSLTADATLYAQWAWDTYDVSASLTNVSVKSGTTGTGAATHGSAYTVTLQGETGYNLPTTVTVTIGGSPATLTTDYTWNSSTGVLTVLAAKVTGNISISATGVAKTTAITLEAGDGGTDGSATATYGTSTITDYEPATRTGYTLDKYQDGSKNNILTKEGTLNTGNKGSLIVDSKWASEDAAVTLYAQWTAIEYTIEYDLAGGSVASPNPTNYTIESSAITLNNPTKTGYTFAGWIGTGLVSATTTVTIAAGSTGNRSYTATWTPIVPSSVSLKASTTITVGETETLTATITPAVVADNTITWTSSDETVAIVTSAGVVTGVKAGTATITATTHNGKAATCEVTVAPAVTYTVTYDAQGGSVTPTSEEVSTATLPTPTKTDYTFQGWYTSGGTLISGTYNPTADITLHALWREDACAGGGGGSTTIISVTIPSKTDNTSGTPASGTIGGTAYWKDLTNNESPFKLNTDNSSYVALRLASGYYAATDQLVITGAGDKKAHYVYTGTHGDGTPLGITDSPSDGVITYTLTGIPASTNEIYIYRLGGTGTTYNGTVASMSVTRAGGGGTCYYVTYNGNGADGGFTKDEASHASGSNVTVKTNSFTKTGYTFTGWNTEAEGTGTPYTASGTISGISGNMTLYAQWEEEVACSTDPTVTAGSNSAVTSTTATVSCASGISSLGTGGCTITSYGFVIGTSTNPVIDGVGVTQHEVGTSIAASTAFSKNLTGLTKNTTYYVRPYATNSHGTAYGTQTSFTTLATYTVTYNGNGATSGDAPVDASSPYDAGSNVTVLGNTGELAKTNYTFDGWTTNNDGTGTSYAADNTFSITANTTLYAKWTQAVTLDKNGGSTDGSATAVWNATGLTGITHAKPAAGYKLLGYYSASSDGTKVLNSDGSFAATNVTGYITSGKWSRTSATTLYAEYESAGALTWNLIVNSDTANLSTSTKTSAFTEISTTNMTNATLAGDLTYEKSKKSALTGKISTPASYDADDYVYVTFQVASGYKFTPSSISVKVQPVGENEHKAVELSLADASNNLVSSSATKCDGTSSGKTTTVTLAGDGTYFTGTVTLKIYVYAHATASATTYNCYRLGTPIEIQGEVEALCATMPSYTSMSYTTTTFAPGDDASGSPITIVGGDNINTYQWKYNTVNDRTSGTDCGTGTSLTPLTDDGAETDGTRYYWCEMTNDACGITIKSPAVAITVAAAKSNATVTWTNPASTPNYGGGGYTIKATVNETEWDGNAADLVITAPAGIRIYNVSSGTDGSSRKYVQADFDVQTSFDRTTYASNIPFTVSAAATATYNAISDDHNVSYSACSGGGVGSSYNIRVRKNYDKDASNNYRWVTPGAGEITYAVGSSISSGKAGTAMATVFDSIMSNDKQYIWVKTFVDNIKQMRLYVETSGANVSVSALYQRTTYAAADAKDVITGYSVVYDEDDDAENTGTKGQHTIDLIFTSALSANDIICVKFSSSKVKALGAAITEGSAGSLNTYLQWSGGLADGATVAKYTTDAYFTYSASKITENTNTLGTITYSSSDPSVATVDATGKVALVAAGSTTIKATLAASGCYKKAEISYTLNVTEVACAITAGTLTLTTGTETKCEDDEVTLTLTGFESGAAIQWKDGDTDINNGGNYTIATDGTTSTLTTNQPGTYSVMVTSGCSVRSNRITISNKSTEVGAKRIVKNWYIKNGRLTPDIELWTLQNGAHLSSVAWSPVNATGLTASDFYERDGKVYLKGKEPSSNTSGADIDYTLTLTVKDDCGSTTDMSASGQLIYLHHQQNTDKHVLAFVVSGTDKGGFTEGITAAQTTSVPLYNEIAANFDVLATNIKSTDDEQALKEYYSQFDILCVTDYPNTEDKGVNKKSYVDALGALVDIRPILTMEAWVSKLANWKAKGISGTPQSPTTRQYTMLLQCKDHEIFSGTERTKVGEGDETMYRVSMVDNTQEEYVSLDATYGAGTHEKDKNYQYGKKPALQGFTFTKEMLDDDLLPLGLIDDGSGNDLQVGIERQTEMEARLMVLGINSYAMERLTDDGQTVVVNALKYLMKKNAEDIADCSIYFTGGDEDEDESTRYNWNVDSHWSNGTQPISTQKVRILAKCVIPSGVQVHVTDVLIVPNGPINHGADVAKGSLTIEAGGALIVDGKVEETTAPNYFHPHATSAENLVLKTSSSAQAALIFDNEEAETQATVNLYSLGCRPSSYQYQYFAVPMEVVPVNPVFANETHGGTGIYTYVYSEASSGWERRKYYDDLFAFEGLGITTKSTGAMNYTMTGNLASTATKEITLTHDGAGLNLVGNSWMAPIQIGALAEDNTDANITKTVYIYCAGRDAEGGAVVSSDDTETAGQWLAVPFEAAEFATWKATGKLSVIPAMQAFEINVSAEATLTLDYDKVVRGSTNDLNAKLRAPGRRMAANEVTMTNIRVADSKTHTDLSLFEGDRFSEAFDNGWEAEYMNGDGRSAKLYAETEAGQMAVAAMYDYEGTVVGFAPGQETEYTFSFMGEDNGYYLNDIKLQNSVRISEGETYTFTYEEGDAANRFYISRTAINAPEVATGMENLDAATPKVQKIIYNDKLYIIRGGRLYDATGKVVK